jgi:hypothetical protein
MQGRIHTISYTNEAIEITQQGQPCGVLPSRCWRSAAIGF